MKQFYKYPNIYKFAAAIVLLMTATLSHAIDAPQNVRGEQVAVGTVQWNWDWVPGASQYELTIDGVVQGTTPNTNYYSENLWVGDHSLRVRAIDSNWQYSADSNTVKLWVSESGGGNSTNNNSTPAQANPAPPPPSQDDTGQIDPSSWGYPEVYQKPGYELSFSDEFNGWNVNPNRWNTQLRWDGEWNGERYEYRVINGESQFYVNTLGPDWEHQDVVTPQHNPFQFDGSRLAIRAVRNPLKQNNGNLGHGPLRQMVAQQEFLSGAIASYDKFTQKYGYFEARIKIPSHVGTFPAFWLHHQKRKYEGTHRSEIDIMENLGHAPWYVYNSFHYFNNVSSSYGGDANFLLPQPQGQIHTGTDYSQDYHVYAVEWEPGRVRWLIDGQQVSELWNSNVDHEELYIILNLAMGGNWTNFPTNSGGLGRSWDQFFPNDEDMRNFQNPALEIDYVRAYRKR